MSLVLGIDTGGTYTDGVIIDKSTKQLIEKAKVLTTKEDFCVCIRNCLNALSKEKLEQVRLVCLSTTMATNAVVEGKGRRTAALIMGKMPHGTLPDSEVHMIEGYLNIQGKVIKNVDLKQVERIIGGMPDDVESIVISGYASVRNPEHEIKVRDFIETITERPVVCAHEISGNLGFYERTVTAILNGQLVPILADLIWDAKAMMREKRINAPMMIVKGDGSYISADYAKHRPIETLLSGPASSIKGAMHLAGMENAVIADMGGTTTDIARVADGKVVVTSDGAMVGGWKTQVRAIDIFTKGLGGDSKILIDEGGNVTIGPEKVVPVCLDAMKIKELHSARSGFTPTDLAHIKGLYHKWDQKASERFAQKWAAELGLKRDDLCDKIEKNFYDCFQNTLLESNQYHIGDILLGIGAPALPWMPLIAEAKGITVSVPEHAEVANAVGAAMGNIEEMTEVIIRRDDVSGKFIAYTAWSRMEFDSLEEAKRTCLEQAKDWLNKKAELCGCKEPNIVEDIEDVYCSTYGFSERAFAETKIRLVAVGQPDFIR